MKKYIYFTFITLVLFSIIAFEFTNIESHENYNLKTLFSISSAFAESGDCNNAKEVLTASKLICTDVSTLGGLYGIQIGSVWDESVPNSVLITCNWEIGDVYKIICYDNAGSICCTELGWTACEASGCPSAGIYTE